MDGDFKRSSPIPVGSMVRANRRRAAAVGAAIESLKNAPGGGRGAHRLHSLTAEAEHRAIDLAECMLQARWPVLATASVIERAHQRNATPTIGPFRLKLSSFFPDLKL